MMTIWMRTIKVCQHNAESRHFALLHDSPWCCYKHHVIFQKMHRHVGGGIWLYAGVRCNCVRHAILSAPDTFAYAIVSKAMQKPSGGHVNDRTRMCARKRACMHWTFTLHICIFDIHLFLKLYCTCYVTNLQWSHRSVCITRTKINCCIIQGDLRPHTHRWGREYTTNINVHDRLRLVWVRINGGAPLTQRTIIVLKKISR